MLGLYANNLGDGQFSVRCRSRFPDPLAAWQICRRLCFRRETHSYAETAKPRTCHTTPTRGFLQREVRHRLTSTPTTYNGGAMIEAVSTLHERRPRMNKPGSGGGGQHSGAAVRLGPLSRGYGVQSTIAYAALSHKSRFHRLPRRTGAQRLA